MCVSVWVGVKFVCVFVCVCRNECASVPACLVGDGGVSASS